MPLSILISTAQLSDPLLGSLIPLLYSSDLKKWNCNSQRKQTKGGYRCHREYYQQIQKKGFRSPQATEPHADCKGADGITPLSVSNPVIPNNGGAKRQTKVRGQPHVLSLNSISYCLCQVQNPRHFYSSLEKQENENSTENLESFSAYRKTVGRKGWKI